MTGLLVWELTLPGSPHPLEERVELDDAGTVRRAIPYPGGTEDPECGWWNGRLVSASLGAASALVEQSWTFDEGRPPPPAAGAWYVSGDPGRIGLWGPRDEPGPGDALRAQLSALLAACIDAASERDCVARFRADWTMLDGSYHPSVRIAATGSQRVALVLDDGPEVAPAAFMNDGFEVVGYSQSELWVPAGSEIFGVLRDRAPGPRGLEIRGELVDELGDRFAFAVTIAMPPIP